jgi:hypothetical protein
MMALEVYFKDDIAQGIVAVTVAMLSASIAHGSTNLEYVRGVLDNSRAQALNYGIPWSAIEGDMQKMLSDRKRGDLLDLVARALPTSQ